MVQISHKPWLDGRNFPGERKLPGGLKPLCLTLPNFLAVVLQEEVEGSWQVLAPSGGPWLLTASRGHQELRKRMGCSQLYQGSQVKSLLREHRGSYLPTQLPKFSQTCRSRKFSHDNFNSI